MISLLKFDLTIFEVVIITDVSLQILHQKDFRCNFSYILSGNSSKLFIIVFYLMKIHILFQISNQIIF